MVPNPGFVLPQDIEAIRFNSLPPEAKRFLRSKERAIGVWLYECCTSFSELNTFLREVNNEVEQTR